MATVTLQNQVETQPEEQVTLSISPPPTSSIRDWPNEAGVRPSPSHPNIPTFINKK
jgi:hypothetical protein